MQESAHTKISFKLNRRENSVLGSFSRRPPTNMSKSKLGLRLKLRRLFEDPILIAADPKKRENRRELAPEWMEEFKILSERFAAMTVMAVATRVRTLERHL